MLKVGVIGVGAMGRHHARVYADIPNVELVGVADLDHTRAVTIADLYQTRAFSDYRDLLSQNIDAVSICVPTSFHHRIALEVIGAGVNLLVEKPLASTLEDAREIINAAKSNDVVLQVGHIERFNPVINVVKKVMEGEEIISIDLVRVGPHPPRVKDVGVVVDIGTHDIDLIRFLSGADFAKINAVIASPHNEFEDAAVLSFRLKNGTIASVVTNRLTPFKIREIKVATKTKLIYGNLLTQQVLEYSHYTADHESYKLRNLHVPFGEPLRLELKSFVDAVKNDRIPEVTGEDGLKSLEVALKCLKNSR